MTGEEGTSDIPAALPLGSLLDNPSVRSFWNQVEAIAGFVSPDCNGDVFDRARTWLLREPRSDRLAGLSTHKFDSLKADLWPTGDVHRGLLRMHYHRDRISEIEAGILEAAQETGVADVLSAAGSSHVIGGGNTFRLDFEYHAFTVGLRSCLDYLAGAVAIYFKQTMASFHRLTKALETWKPRELAMTITELANVNELHEYWSGTKRTSVRDRVSHYEPIRSGNVNISGRGLELVDVPESSATGRFGVNFGPLIPIIDGHIGRVHRVVEGTIDALANFDGKSLPRI